MTRDEAIAIDALITATKVYQFAVMGMESQLHKLEPKWYDVDATLRDVRDALRHLNRRRAEVSKIITPVLNEKP